MKSRLLYKNFRIRSNRAPYETAVEASGTDAEFVTGRTLLKCRIGVSKRERVCALFRTGSTPPGTRD